MGIRLFPGNDLTPEQQEQVAGVPSGTAALHRSYQDLARALRSVGNGYGEYELFGLARERLPNLAKYDDFVTSGWGKPTLTILGFMEGFGLDLHEAGQTKNVHLIAAVLGFLGVPVDAAALVTQLCWG